MAAEGPVVRQLAQHYRYVMVDEFQDTDPLQWALIRPLISRAGALERDKLFIVGDPKQSIYSFRDADVTVFEDVKQAIVQGNNQHQSPNLPFRDDGEGEVESLPEERGGALIMAENFRTLRVPVAFVNLLFEQIIHPVAGEPFQVGYDPLICRRPHPTSQGSVELLLARPREEEEEQDTLQREAELMARRIRQILDQGALPIADEGEAQRPARPEDIAILLRRRRFLPLYEQALRSLHIPFEVVGGLGFYQRQEVYDLANILHILDNPFDNVALLGALRSPYLGLSDNALFALSQVEGSRLVEKLENLLEQDGSLSSMDRAAVRDAVALLQRWSGLVDRVALTDLLHTILEDTGAWGFLGFGERGEQTIANVEKILALARNFEAPGFSALADFVAHLDLLIEQEEEGEAQMPQDQGHAVRILTVHASKGLEFPVVFVPDLDGPFNLSSADPLLLDGENGIGILVQDPENDFRRKPSFVRATIGATYQRKILAEEKRLFYVAATRARDHLILCGRLRENHLALEASFETVKDRLSWVCLGLGLCLEDLARGEKFFSHNGQDFVVRLLTDLAQIPVDHPPSTTGESTYFEARAYLEELHDNIQDSGIALPPDLQDLQPIPTPDPPPLFSATQLTLYEESPSRYFDRYILGIPETGLGDGAKGGKGGEQRRRGLLFGELAHAALEASALDPDEDRAAWVDRLLLEAALGDPDLHQRFHHDLMDLLARFEDSVFGRALSADPAARIEQAFTLKLKNGIIQGVIDRICKDPEGTPRIIDYKTGPVAPQAKATEAQRHRRQMQIYALCLQRLYPDQPSYRATIYFTALDQTCTFAFTTADLRQAEEEIEQLMQEVSSRWPLPWSQ